MTGLSSEGYVEEISFFYCFVKHLHDCSAVNIAFSVDFLVVFWLNFHKINSKLCNSQSFELKTVERWPQIHKQKVLSVFSFNFWLAKKKLGEDLPEKEPLISSEFIQKFKDFKFEDSESPYEDSVEYFNRKHWSKEQLQKMNVSPGAFYKCRSEDGAVYSDLELHNKLYKRWLATFALMMAHCYATISILYDSQIVTAAKTPRLFKLIPIVAYPSLTFGFVGFVSDFLDNKNLLFNWLKLIFDL